MSSEADDSFSGRGIPDTSQRRSVGFPSHTQFTRPVRSHILEISRHVVITTQCDPTVLQKSVTTPLALEVVAYYIVHNTPAPPSILSVTQYSSTLPRAYQPTRGSPRFCESMSGSAKRLRHEALPPAILSEKDCHLSCNVG
jgi:hypothetical protein